MGRKDAAAEHPVASRAHRGLWALVALAVIALASIALLLPDASKERGTVTAFVGEYCVDCHNTTDFDGGFAFNTVADDVTVTAPGADDTATAIWERAVRKVRAGLMPPARAPRPSEAALDAFATRVENRLDRAWLASPDPGSEPLSRLNRAEYVNAIRDLLDFDASRVVETLPRDEVVAGFDNIGDALGVSPTLIESYVGAAIRISREAVGDRSATPTQIRYEVADRLSQDQHIDGLPPGTRGGLIFTHQFPLDAEYEFHVASRGRGAIATQSFCEAPEIVLAVDGRLLDVPDARAFRMYVPAGPHEVAAALADKSRCSGVNELFDFYSTAGAIQHVEIHGPYNPVGVGDTPSRRAIFSCMPRDDGAEAECAREILSRLATLAFRRPVGVGDPSFDVLMDFFRAGREEGGFETGIQRALARLLMNPQFIFQFEHEPEDLAPGQAYPLSDLEIATRMAFFLWSSIPDKELIELASEGRLTEPDVLESQTLRMLSDERARALVDNFVGQWLSLRELREALPQDPDFDANLLSALESETTLLVSSFIQSDRSLLGMLDTNFTYLNERLARHYGIDGVRGSYMRKVELEPQSPRRGLLGHASWLTATSVADRTSPVKRGEWYITHLLGAPVPSPPPGVEADLSDEAEIAKPSDTLRERLERHRSNPTCASCHQIMDPIGLALENFDLVGRWRDIDNGRAIDTATVLTDGTEVDGIGDLRQYLQRRPELFITVFTEKLLTYALGRVVDYRDMPAIRRIVREAAKDDYRFRSVVLGIVASEPFQMRTKSGEAPLVTASASGEDPTL